MRQLLQAASFVLLARLLSPEVWGLVGIALIFTVAGTSLLVEAGWLSALVRAREPSAAMLDTVFWTALAAAVLYAGLLALAAGPVARWFDQPDVAPVLRSLAWSVPLAALSLVPRALLMRTFAFRALALRSVLGAAAGGLAGVGLAAAGAGAWSLVAFQLAQPAAEAVVLWRTVDSTGWRPALRFSPPVLRELTGYVTCVFGEKVCNAVDTVLPRLILGQALGPLALGYFTLARRTLEVSSQLVIIPLNRVALPSFAEVQTAPEDASSLPRLQSMALLSARASAIVGLPVFLGLAIVADELVPLLFGEHWAAAVPAVRLAALLGPAVCLMSVLAQLLLALGRSKEILRQAAVGTALLALFLAVLPGLDVTGVVLAILVRTYALLPLRLADAARATRLPILQLALCLLPVLLAALGMAAMLIGLRATAIESLSPPLRLAVSVPAGVLAYAVLLAAADRPLVRQVLTAGRLFRRAVRRP
jgi:PST family polysaccharide transporter